MSSPHPSGPTVYLHIGCPKTGTSFIQGTLRHQEELLREVGIVLPGDQKGDHFRAALDLRGDLSTGLGPGERFTHSRAKGAWPRLVGKMLAVDGTAIVTSEWLSHADAEHAARALRDLADADLHVVVTARDPERQLVSAFQQRIKMGQARDFRKTVRNVSQDGALNAAQQLDTVLDRWGGGLEPDHVHVVTVPPSGSDPRILWDRFAHVVGIDSSRFGPTSKEVNETLGVAEIELLRRVNVALDGRIPHPAYGRTVHATYVKEILAGSPTAIRPAAPESTWPLLDEIAEQWIEAVKMRGYDVSGDLADLRPAHRPGATPDSASSEQLADAAIRATAELLIRLAANQRGPTAARGWANSLRVAFGDVRHRLRR